MDDGTTLAPEGQIYVCMACGKTSKTKYGYDKQDKDVAMYGWDVSCMLNSRLIPEKWVVERSEGGRVLKIDVPPESADPDTSEPSPGPQPASP